MAVDNNLKVDELNFQGIKQNFKNYLQSQEQFKDYNFEASGLSVLLDLLAYNTYYNAFYQNMILNESFLRTATRRDSVVNHAKLLNYRPRTITSSKITGTLVVTPVGTPELVTIPAYTKFTGSINGRTFTFQTTAAVNAFLNSAGQYVAENVTMTEGTLITRTFTVTSDPEQRFILANDNMDAATLEVSVLNSSTDATTRVFSSADNLINLDSFSRIYWLEEIEDEFYELRFGDGQFGVTLDVGNIVIARFLSSFGVLANNIRNLRYASAISGVNTISFVADDPSFGGAEKETLEQIKYNAPKSFNSQNRIITVEDYKAFMLTQPNIDSVSVWGGEDNDPPVYGRVFIAVKPQSGEVLSPTEKDNLIKGVLKDRKILTVGTEIVDPEYIYLLVNSVVKYDAKATALSAAAIEQLIYTKILQYNDDDIDQFSKYFRYSKLSKIIDNTERSILNNILSIQMQKELDVQLSIATRYDINFSNPINNVTLGRPVSHPFGIGNQITSNAFTFQGFENCFLEDNNGIIRIYRQVGIVNIGISLNAGTIDYDTGKIVLTAFAPTAFADGGNTLKIIANPRSTDILPLRNQILSIRAEDISITMIDDNTISLVSR